MDENKKIAQEQEQPVAEKKAYTPPALTRYGKLTELTATGTGMDIEAGMSDQNPFRMA